MKRFQKTAIAFAVAVVAPMAIAGPATQDDVDISVTAEVLDLIQVVASEGQKSLTLTGNNVEDWYAMSRLGVFRRGATSDNVLNYELTVTGPNGSSGEDFVLSTTDETPKTINVNVSYEAFIDNAVDKSGDLQHAQATTDQLPVNQSMYGASSLHGQTNLHLTFKLPQSELEQANVGTYFGDFTVMVSAI